MDEWTGQIDEAEIHDHELTPEEIAAKAGIWFGWMCCASVWTNPDHTIKGFEHLGPLQPQEG